MVYGRFVKRFKRFPCRLLKVWRYIEVLQSLFGVIKRGLLEGLQRLQRALQRVHKIL